MMEMMMEMEEILELRPEIGTEVIEAINTIVAITDNIECGPSIDDGTDKCNCSVCHARAKIDAVTSKLL